MTFIIPNQATEAYLAWQEACNIIDDQNQQATEIWAERRNQYILYGSHDFLTELPTLELLDYPDQPAETFCITHPTVYGGCFRVVIRDDYEVSVPF